MASYFYLMSSLPMLKTGGEMPITYGEFLSSCEGNVSAAKYELLKNLDVESTEGPLVKEWSEFYDDYLGELTYQRGRKLGRTSAKARSNNGDASKTISIALAEKNPLVAERLLLDLQFDKLDSLIGVHAFDDYALFGYALKLKLLERQTVYIQKDGRAELDRLVQDIEQKIKNINYSI